MCRRGALKLLGEGKISQEQFDALFGNTSSASYFVFYDAWYDPASVDRKPFHRDVITVHHPKYYQSGNTWPTDFDDPTPVPFLVVKPRTQFLFAIQAPDEKWGKFVESLLNWCLQNLGIGGKTNAGYGYFKSPELRDSSSLEKDSEVMVKKQAVPPPGTVVAEIVDPTKKPIQVKIVESGQMVSCSGVNPPGLGLEKGSLIFVTVNRDKKTGTVISSRYAGKP